MTEVKDFKFCNIALPVLDKKRALMHSQILCGFISFHSASVVLFQLVSLSVDDFVSVS